MIYVLAQFSFTDLPRYRSYQSRFAQSFVGSGGTVLAADEQVRVVEGAWPFSKVVLLRFPDEDAYRKWYTSDAYQAIVGDRLGATTGCVVLVHGLPPTAGTAGG